jgi:hypothetical protein
MFVVETTWQGKKHAHSWLTCISRSREVALQQMAAITEPQATHQLFEIEQNSFPVFFVTGFKHVSVEELKTKLAEVLPGDSDDVLFNVYRFRDEYRWRDPDLRYQTEYHWHITPMSISMNSMREPETWLFE